MIILIDVHQILFYQGNKQSHQVFGCHISNIAKSLPYIFTMFDEFAEDVEKKSPVALSYCYNAYRQTCFTHNL